MKNYRKVKRVGTTTPGPWTVEVHPYLGVSLLSETTKEPVALLGLPDEVGIADLTLICQAPEMAELLAFTREVLRRGREFNEDCEPDGGLQALLRDEHDLRLRLDAWWEKMMPIVESTFPVHQGGDEGLTLTMTRR